MGNFNPPDLQPNTDVVVPEGYVHYGPANAGVTLPEGTDFKDSMLLGGFMSSTGENPYYPDGASSGNLSLGGSPYDTANMPPETGLPKINIDDLPQGGDDPNWGSTRDQLLNGVPTGGVDPGTGYLGEPGAGDDPVANGGLSLGGYPIEGGILGPGDGYGGISDGQGGGWVSGANGSRVPNPANPASSVNDSFGSSGGAVTGPAAQPGNIFDAITPEKTGYESSSNKDFYQQQMQEMRATQKGQKLNELAAAMRRQEASNAPPEQAFGGDPWSWANLPEVQTGGSVAATPIEWGLNDAYGITQDMTNRQAVGALSPVLNTDEMAIMNAHWADSPPSSTNNNWLTSNPQALSAQFSANSSDTVSPEFTNVMQKIFNNLYTQTGGGTGGISVPAGYANPVNTQGV